MSELVIKIYTLVSQKIIGITKDLYFNPPSYYQFFNCYSATSRPTSGHYQPNYRLNPLAHFSLSYEIKDIFRTLSSIFDGGFLQK